MQGSRGRGRPRLGREDCVERDLAGVGGEWRTSARDRGSGDGNETGPVTKKKENKHQRPVPASSRT